MKSNIAVNKRSIVIGHRGFPELYPENSLVGVQAAIDAGVGGVEIDVQLTKDGIPVVLHDSTLARISGVSDHKLVYEYLFDEIKTVSVHEPSRFGSKFSGVCVSPLSVLCDQYKDTGLPLIIELKSESLESCSVETYIERVLTASNQLAKDNRILISYSAKIVEVARDLFQCRAGWIMNVYDEHHLEQARDINPEIVVCNVKRIPNLKVINKEKWDWCLYDIVDPEVAKKCMEMGVKYIESWDPPKIIF